MSVPHLHAQLRHVSHLFYTPHPGTAMNQNAVRQTVFLSTGKDQPTLPGAAYDRQQNRLYRIAADCLAEKEQTPDWTVDAWAGPSGSWTYVRNKSVSTPSQGWKLHVSSNAACAAEVLAATMDVLLGEPGHFKFAADMDVLRRLNRGELGLTQVGKFITIYPTDDAQAVRLAAQLHARTAGLSGPAIPTDRQLSPGSLVHFRYGDFLGREQQLPTGERRPVLADPDGKLVADVRLTRYQKPDWVRDPFGGGVERTEVPAPGTVAGGRFLIVGELAEMARGSVLLAVDMALGRRCVLKTARRHCHADHRGRDAWHYLQREYELLNVLADDPRVPQPYQLVEEGTDLLMLIMEDIPGERLDAYVAQRLAQGAPLADHEVIDIGIAAAQIVADLHARGISHADIKSTNLILSPGGELKIIDFGIAYSMGEDIADRPPGTRGYRSRSKNAVQADTYALGALLYFLATGAEPSRAPEEFHLLGRPVALLAPGRGRALAALIESSLADEEQASPAQLLAGLLGVYPPAPDTKGLCAVRAQDGAEAPASPGLVMRLQQSIVNALERGLRPRSSWTAAAELARDLNDGRAGAVLALAETASATHEPAALAALGQAAHSLACAAGTLPGLYAGEAGVGVALLRAGQVTGDAALVTLAAARGEWVAAQPHTSPDIYVGSAGRALFHLLLWSETRDPAALQAAVVAGQALLRTAARSAQGWSWTIPDGFEPMAGQCYLGYAHGAAGIGDTLLDLWTATGDEAYAQAAGEVVRFLISHAQPLANGGANWPDTPAGRMAGTCWCHGAAGVAVFLAHALATGRFPETQEWLNRAGHAVATGSRVLNPGQCHGLAGSIECLLDLHLATGEPRWLDEARTLRVLLEAFVVERDGAAVACSEHPDDFACTYLTGYAGVAACLSRFSGERISARFIGVPRFSRTAA